MTAWRHPLLWLRAHPRAMDVGLTLVLVALTLATTAVPDPTGERRDPTVLAYLLGAAGTLPIAWRRRQPIAVLAVSSAFTLASQGANFPESTLVMAPVIAAYSVGAYVQSRRLLRLTAIVVLAVLVVGNVASAVIESQAANLLSAVGNGIIFGTAFLFGDNMRRRRERMAELEEKAAAEETTRQALAREAVAAERQRIARELHDVVAHSLSVMVVQAGAARRLVTTRPDRAVAALGAIETTGREALDEMRRLLGVFRADDGRDGSDDAGPAVLEPQPSLSRLHDLTDADPERPVAVVVEGSPAALPAAVDLQAYRIVQEALTNVRKHAGLARATVLVRYAADAVEVRIDDDGRGASAHAPAGEGGHGLVGMRERAALCGGELRAGPRTGGGWSVSARLPLAPRAGAGAA